MMALNDDIYKYLHDVLNSINQTETVVRAALQWGITKNKI